MTSTLSQDRPRSTLRRLGLALVALAAGFPALAAAQGLMLTPTRVVFEGRTRAAQLDIVNTSAETEVYRLKLVNRRMTPEGRMVDVDEPLPGEQFADGMIRFSPRQITLAPGGSQAVRVMVRKPADLAAGEYRSHLLFERIPQDKAQAPADPGKDLSIRLDPNISVSIPVIVREGDTRAEVTISALELERVRDGDAVIPVLAFELHRSGSRSVYGNLVAEWTDGAGRSEIVGDARGVAVYTPNPMRKVRLALALPASTAGGSLRLRFEEATGLQAEGRLALQ